MSERILVVTAAIVNKPAKRLFMQRRSGTTRFPWHWGTPGGKAVFDELSYEALLRELFEEHGVVLMPRGILKRRVYEYQLDENTLVQCIEVPHDKVLGEYKAGPSVAGFDWPDANELENLTLTPADHANRGKLLALIR
jgi:8-oxo-dGTP pyrophosphatase MutT (NUDIX family)